VPRLRWPPLMTSVQPRLRALRSKCSAPLLIASVRQSSVRCLRGLQERRSVDICEHLEGGLLRRLGGFHRWRNVWEDCNDGSSPSVGTELWHELHEFFERVEVEAPECFKDRLFEGWRRRHEISPTELSPRAFGPWTSFWPAASVFHRPPPKFIYLNRSFMHFHLFSELSIVRRSPIQLAIVHTRARPCLFRSNLPAGDLGLEAVDGEALFRLYLVELAVGLGDADGRRMQGFE
jgi:hypothetical protein